MADVAREAHGVANQDGAVVALVEVDVAVDVEAAEAAEHVVVLHVVLQSHLAHLLHPYAVLLHAVLQSHLLHPYAVLLLVVLQSHQLLHAHQLHQSAADLVASPVAVILAVAELQLSSYYNIE